MIKPLVDNMLEIAKKRKNAVVVGAGKLATNLIALLQLSGVNVVEIFDSSDVRIGNNINGIQIVKPHRLTTMDVIYIIDVKEEKIQNEIKEELELLGIDENDIIIQPHTQYTKDEIDNADEEQLKSIINDMYYERFAKDINWNHISTYNEYIYSGKKYMIGIR